MCTMAQKVKLVYKHSQHFLQTSGGNKQVVLYRMSATGTKNGDPSRKVHVVSLNIEHLDLFHCGTFTCTHHTAVLPNLGHKTVMDPFPVGVKSER